MKAMSPFVCDGGSILGAIVELDTEFRVFIL